MKAEENKEEFEGNTVISEFANNYFANILFNV